MNIWLLISNPQATTKRWWMVVVANGQWHRGKGGGIDERRTMTWGQSYEKESEDTTIHQN